jgi:hypothetical protein
MISASIRLSSLSLSVLLVALFLSQSSHAFTPNHSHSNLNSSTKTTSTKSTSTTQLQSGLFGNMFGKKEKEEPYDPSVPKRIMEIKTNSIKSGGLRFALGLFFIGSQGTPVKGSWKANQASDGVLDMYYKDNTAMFSVTLTEKLISIDRYGLPSLQYQLQESLILHLFLDELYTLAFENEEIEDENRLVVFADPENAIEEARATLPARIEG